MAVSLATALCMTSCAGDGAYDEGFDDGYDAGYEIGYQQGSEESYSEYELEESFDAGYDYAIENCLYEDEIIWRIEEDAVHFARHNSEWHPEEALVIIESYQNNEPFNEDGSPPSWEDYTAAIQTLVSFYEYFYCQ